jgi:hypothetical protein
VGQSGLFDNKQSGSLDLSLGQVNSLVNLVSSATDDLEPQSLCTQASVKSSIFCGRGSGATKLWDASLRRVIMSLWYLLQQTISSRRIFGRKARSSQSSVNQIGGIICSRRSALDRSCYHLVGICGFHRGESCRVILFGSHVSWMHACMDLLAKHDLSTVRYLYLVFVSVLFRLVPSGPCCQNL